jgi:hypothetical protein
MQAARDESDRAMHRRVWRSALMQQTKERTGYRDTEWLSERHHLWHPSLSMTDIDWICIEMVYANPVALVDYKRMAPRKLELTTSIRGVRNLATIARISFFIVFYQHEPPIFWLQPMNAQAIVTLGTTDIVTMSEREYVVWLFALRREPLPDDVPDWLSVVRS